MRRTPSAPKSAKGPRPGSPPRTKHQRIQIHAFPTCTLFSFSASHPTIRFSYPFCPSSQTAFGRHSEERRLRRRISSMLPRPDHHEEVLRFDVAFLPTSLADYCAMDLQSL